MISECKNIHCHFSTDDSSVNFEVPDQNILRDKSKKLPTDNRGIITEMMDDISRNEPDLILTYKICFVGTGSTQIQRMMWIYWDMKMNPH